MIIIEHIDKIARIKQRDVLYLTFDTVKNNRLNKKKYGKKMSFFRLLDEIQIYDEPDDNPNRQIIMDWLTENNIAFQPCANIASTCGWESYRGQIYIDVPFDTSNEVFQKIQKFLYDDNKGWCRRFKAVRFFYLPFNVAIKNAYHDEPGFWEKWAETF